MNTVFSLAFSIALRENRFSLLQSAALIFYNRPNVSFPGAWPDQTVDYNVLVRR